MDRDGAGCVAAVFFALLLWAIIATICAYETQRSWKAEMIERGHAEYNSANGSWQWKPKAEVGDGDE
jgi:hypothetical protein